MELESGVLQQLALSWGTQLLLLLLLLVQLLSAFWRNYDFDTHMILCSHEE